uniref:TLC domain-containing protein n=1 Tax=Aegilops tauschii subsp. strangulata TaxID=200361 RepID=A0A453ENL8_AEGTS
WRTTAAWRAWWRPGWCSGRRRSCCCGRCSPSAPTTSATARSPPCTPSPASPSAASPCRTGPPPSPPSPHPPRRARSGLGLRASPMLYLIPDYLSIHGHGYRSRSFAGIIGFTRLMRALAVTLSYMIYDGACCHLSGDARLDNALHHLISIVGLAAGLAYQRCGTELVACLLVTEISSPLLHLREMLKELGVKDTDLNLLVDILFAVTFSVARMVCGTYVTYRTVTADNPILIKTMATSLLLVSAYWFLRILRMVRHKIGKKRLASKAAGKGSM